jgi:phage gpG-like protein
MTVQLSWSIEGEKQISRRFNKIPKDMGNMSVPLFKIGRELRKSVDENYSQRGSLFGAKWEPRKDNKRHPLLEKTGKMRRGFQQRIGEGYVEIYNVEDYFKYHQSNKPRTRLPRRLMLKIDDIRKTFITKEFQRHIQKRLREEG